MEYVMVSLFPQSGSVADRFTPVGLPPAPVSENNNSFPTLRHLYKTVN